MANFVSLPLTLRICNVLTAYLRYIGGLFWPFDLTMFYPYQTSVDSVYITYAVIAAEVLLVVTGVAIAAAFYGRRYLVVGWFWFLGTMVPVIGLVQVGDQSMADRYSYFTFTGLFIMLVWGATDLLGRWPQGRVVLAAVAAVVLAGCVGLTTVQAGYWENTTTALEHTLMIASDNPAAQNNLGVTMWEKAEGTRGAKPESEAKIREYRNKAIMHWREAVRIRPAFSDALNNLGCALRHRDPDVKDDAYQKQLLEAEKCFRAAIAYKPEHSDAHSNLALTLWQLKKPPKEAIAEFKKALELRPDHADAHVTFAQILWEMAEDAAQHNREQEAQQRLEEALDHVNPVVHLDDSNARAFELLGRIRKKQGKAAEAAWAKLRAAWLMATSPRAASRQRPHGRPIEPGGAGGHQRPAEASRRCDAGGHGTERRGSGVARCPGRRPGRSESLPRGPGGRPEGPGGGQPAGQGVLGGRHSRAHPIVSGQTEIPRRASRPSPGPPNLEVRS